mgnify:CR=1 FL=1
MKPQKKPANRKLIYIWDENLAYFNSLANKSAAINLLLKKARADGWYQTHQGAIA